MKRPAPGLNNMPKIPSKKSPPPLAKPRANILKSDDTSEFKSAFSNRIVSIVLLNPYPTINGSVKEINFRIFCFCFIIMNIKKKNRGMIIKIISPLIMNPNIKKLAEIVEYNILGVSRNFLKYKNPARAKNTEGTILYDV